MPVRIFNISAKVMALPVKTNICQLQEVKVLRSLSITKDDNLTCVDNDTPLRTAQVNQQRAEPNAEMPKVDLVGAFFFCCFCF